MRGMDVTVSQRDVSFRVVSPVPRDQWESVTKSCDDLFSQQSLPWHDAVLADGVYKDASLLYEFPSGRQVLLPMVRRRWRTPLEPAPSSWPRAWGVGGPVTSDGHVDPAEAAAVLRDVVRRDMFGAEIHLSHISDPVWLDAAAASQLQVLEEPCYVLDLAGGFGEVWQHRFRGTVRTAVRKAERSGLEVEVDRSGKRLDVFYGLYEKSVERWSGILHEPAWFARWHLTRATPMSMLKAVAERFGEDCATWVAWSGGEPAAAIIVLRTGSRAHYWRGAMDKALAGPTRAAQLLQKLAIEDACDSGRRAYDMGMTDPGTSLADFKERFGATLSYTHYLQSQVPAQRVIGAPKAMAKRVAYWISRDEGYLR